MKKAIIVTGVPGAGKGTQAELISNKFNLIRFDTGKFLESFFYFSDKELNEEDKKQKELFKTGKLVEPEYILEKIKEHTQKIYNSDNGIIFSGSPRTMLEAFGDEKNIGLMKFLEDLYGKDDIITFHLDISDKEAIKRNSSRLICSVCKSPILATSFDDVEKDLKACPFCGGKLRKRVIDNPKTMKVRLDEYREKTKPVVDKIESEGYNVYEINGEGKPYEVFGLIEKIINDTLEK